MGIDFGAVSADLMSLGFVVFPLVPNGKAPATKRGFKEATDDEWIWGEWVSHGKPYNVGIPTGAMNGITVIDCDSYKDGGASIRLLKEAGLTFPKTVMARTGKGGWHLFYKDAGLKNTVGKIAANIDVRGDGGYVVAPGSYLDEVDKAGKHWQGYYEWVNHPNDVEYAELPQWVIDTINREEKVVKPVRILQPPMRDANTLGLYNFLGGVQKGQRNNSLYWAACKYAEEIVDGKIPLGRAQAEMVSAASQCGLDDREIAATVKSAFKRWGLSS